MKQPPESPRLLALILTNQELQFTLNWRLFLLVPESLGRLFRAIGRLIKSLLALLKPLPIALTTMATVITSVGILLTAIAAVGGIPSLPLLVQQLIRWVFG